MLEFNPYFRLTAEEALKCKVFDSIRVNQFEEPSPIKLSIDAFKADSFNYENLASEKFGCI